MGGLYKRLKMIMLLSKNKKNKQFAVDSHAKAQRSWHVCLPVGTVEHKHPGEAAEEHPVRIGSHLDCYTGSQHHKHCRDKHKKQSVLGEAGRFIVQRCNKQE